MFGSRLFYKTDLKKPASDDRIEATLGEANVVSSQCVRPGWHQPVLDIDFPAMLIPSSTPGHFHLYLDKEIPETKFFRMLDAMADAGVLGKGYVRHSKERRATFVRLPWISKQPGEDSSS